MYDFKGGCLTWTTEIKRIKAKFVISHGSTEVVVADASFTIFTHRCTNGLHVTSRTPALTWSTLHSSSSTIVSIFCFLCFFWFQFENNYLKIKIIITWKILYSYKNIYSIQIQIMIIWIRMVRHSSS